MSAQQDQGEQLHLLPSTARMQLVESKALHTSALYGSFAPDISLGWESALCTPGPYTLLGMDAASQLWAELPIQTFIRCAPGLEALLAGAFTTQPAVCCTAMKMVV